MKWSSVCKVHLKSERTEYLPSLVHDMEKRAFGVHISDVDIGLVTVFVDLNKIGAYRILKRIEGLSSLVYYLNPPIPHVIYPKSTESIDIDRPRRKKIIGTLPHCPKTINQTP